MNTDPVKENVISRLNRKDIIALCSSSPEWQKFCKEDNPILWRKIIQRDNLIVDLPRLDLYNLYYNKSYDSWYDLYRDGSFLIRKSVAAINFTGEAILDNNSIYYWGLGTEELVVGGIYHVKEPIVNLSKTTSRNLVITTKGLINLSINDTKIPNVPQINLVDVVGNEALYIALYRNGNVYLNSKIHISDNDTYIAHGRLVPLLTTVISTPSTSTVSTPFTPPTLPTHRAVISTSTKLTPKAVKVVAGNTFVMVLYADMTVHCWGFILETVNGLLRIKTRYHGEQLIQDVIDIYTYENNYVFVTTEGSIVTADSEYSPEDVTKRIVSINLRNNFVILLNDNTIEERDVNYILIKTYNFDSKVIKMDSGYNFTVVLLENGTLFTFGDNSFGQAPGIINPPIGRKFITR